MPGYENRAGCVRRCEHACNSAGPACVISRIVQGTNQTTAARPGLWIGSEAALFDHRCPAGAASTEFFVSAPCVVLVRRGAFRTTSALGEAMADAGSAVFRNALSGYRVHDIPSVEHDATTLRIRAATAREMLLRLDPGGADRE